MTRFILTATLVLGCAALAGAQAPQTLPPSSAWEFSLPDATREQAWQPSTDSVMGGASTAAVRVDVDPAGTRALHVQADTRKGAPLPFAGALAGFGARPFQPADFSPARRLRFRIKGEGGGIAVALYSAPMGFVPAVQVIELTPEWKTYSLELRAFAGLDASKLTGLAFTRSVYPGKVDFWVDGIRFE